MRVAIAITFTFEVSDPALAFDAIDAALDAGALQDAILENVDGDVDVANEFAITSALVLP